MHTLLSFVCKNSSSYAPWHAPWHASPFQERKNNNGIVSHSKYGLSRVSQEDKVGLMLNITNRASPFLQLLIVGPCQGGTGSPVKMFIATGIFNHSNGMMGLGKGLVMPIYQIMFKVTYQTES